MNNKWNYKDILDLEYLLQADDEQTPEQLHRRDRDIALHAGFTSDNGPPDSGRLLRTWLQSRRKDLEATVLPGEIFAEALSALRLFLIAAGALSGISAGLLFFSYSGDTPVNVLHFLAVFVISQIVLTLLFLLKTAACRFGQPTLPNTISLLFLRSAAGRIGRWLQRQTRKYANTDQRLEVMATLGRLQVARSRYGTLLYWPLFLLLQVFGVFFNLGLLSATLFRVTVSDLAFGWQSTLQISSEQLHSFTAALALPWSWLFGEGIGHPDLEQIEGTRIILKEGISSLATTDLISWWPFLLLSVAFYGLFLRCGNYLTGLYFQYRAQTTLQVDTPGARQVARRMCTPLMTTQAKQQSQDLDAQRSSTPQPAAGDSQQAAIPAQPIQVLIPDDIYPAMDFTHLSHLLESEGYSPLETLRFQSDYESDQILINEAGSGKWQQAEAIMVLMEAWLPPLVSFETFIKDLRRRIGSTVPIIIRLIGKPEEGVPLPPVSDPLSIRVWQQKMAALGDPYLEIDALSKEANP